MKKRARLHLMLASLFIFSTVLPSFAWEADEQIDDIVVDPNMDYHALLMKQPVIMNLYVFYDGDNPNLDHEVIQQYLQLSFLEFFLNTGTLIVQKDFRSVYGLPSTKGDVLLNLVAIEHLTLLPNDRTLVISNLSDSYTVPMWDPKTWRIIWVDQQVLGWSNNGTRLVAINNFNWQAQRLTKGCKVELIQCIEHELGHARGLDHNEEDETSIMYPYLEPSLGQWTQADLARLYANRAEWQSATSLSQ